MTNALALQQQKIYIKCAKHTHYHLRGKTVQYISVNNILGIKFCFAVEPTLPLNLQFESRWFGAMRVRCSGCRLTPRRKYHWASPCCWRSPCFSL